MKNYLIMSAVVVGLLAPAQAYANAERVKWSPSATGKTLRQAKGGAENLARYQAEEFCRAKGGVKSLSVIDWKTSSAYDKSSYSASMQYKTVCSK